MNKLIRLSVIFRHHLLRIRREVVLLTNGIAGLLNGTSDKLLARDRLVGVVVLHRLSELSRDNASLDPLNA